ncbi:MAG: hypothetical protein AMXMBFR64_33480 [Myxococcales bacterium]
MATTVREIAGFLDERGIKYDIKGDSRIVTGFRTKSFTNVEGEKSIVVVILLQEDGRYFQVYAPLAMRAEGPHQEAFMKACMAVQWKTKLIQFEMDPQDGEIRPTVEFPLEDAPLTAAQLHRSIGGLITLLEEYYPVLEKALKTGQVEFPEEPQDRMMRMLQEMMRTVDPLRMQLAATVARITELRETGGDAVTIGVLEREAQRLQAAIAASSGGPTEL